VNKQNCEEQKLKTATLATSKKECQTMIKIKRRDFLKAVGIGTTATAAGCSTDPISWDPLVPIEKAYPYIVQPEQIIPGTPSYFTTGCTQCATGCGLMAKVREGRVINIQGNTKHPTSNGKICIKGLAGLQQTYSPDRIAGPQKSGKSKSWQKILAEDVFSACNKNVGWVGTLRTGASNAIVEQFMESLGNASNLKYWEPLGVESLIKSTSIVFGVKENRVPVYKIDNAHTILSFGADFLGTWSSMNLEIGWANSRDYAQGGFVSKMYTVGPRIGTTEAMTDIHINVNVGYETAFALALAKELANKNKYNGPALTALAKISSTSKELLSKSGVKQELFDELLGRLQNGGLSVVLPGGAATSHNSTELAVATLLLNEVAGNIGKSVVFGQEQNVQNHNSAAEVAHLITNGKLNTLFIEGVDIAHVFASNSKVKEALKNISNIIIFSDEANETAFVNQKNTIILPVGSSLEKWGDNEAIIGRNTIHQAVMVSPNNNVTMSVEDIILQIAKLKGRPAVIPTTPVTNTTDESTVETKSDENDKDKSSEAETQTEEIVSPYPTAPGFEVHNFHEYVKTWWHANVYPKYKSAPNKQPVQSKITEGKAFKDFWINVLQNGGYFEEIAAIKIPVSSTIETVSFTEPKLDGSEEFNLLFFPHPYIVDGRHANRPWSREIPEAMTGFSWDTWIEVNPETATKIGLVKNKGAVLKTSATSGSINVGWFGSPGIAKDTIAVVMGAGKSNSGRYAKYGSDPMPLLDHRLDPISGEISYVSTKASVSPSNEQNSPNPKNNLIKSDTLTTNDRYINFTSSIDDVKDPKNKDGKRSSIVPMHHLPDDSMAIRSRHTTNRFNPDEKLTDMYPEPEHPTYRFAKVIDLNKCNGCGACEAACYAENNIPVVGPDQMRLGRGLSWIRMSRYWEGTDVLETGLPDIRYQPVLCQQCTHAPCEGVCPVLATYHNLDGINAMIYNRCVGTRYCANNCPYSARRFNFHTYRWPESFNLMLNPDVLVREMGVMEKCTFCIQKIRDFKDEWRDKNGVNKLIGQKANLGKDAQKPTDEDYNRITACGSACPTDAIVFGNLKDENSLVYKKYNDKRSYLMLEELNNKPGVAYMARVVHTKSKLHHGGDHGGGHDDDHGNSQGHNDKNHKPKEHH
jgi:Fe-S-cluster-containing dehydrogenase component/anaerobic selenocysteine-containing dehydrogenase